MSVTREPSSTAVPAGGCCSVTVSGSAQFSTVLTATSKPLPSSNARASAERLLDHRRDVDLVGAGERVGDDPAGNKEHEQSPECDAADLAPTGVVVPRAAVDLGVVDRGGRDRGERGRNRGVGLGGVERCAELVGRLEAEGRDPWQAT